MPRSANRAGFCVFWTTPAPLQRPLRGKGRDGVGSTTGLPLLLNLLQYSLHTPVHFLVSKAQHLNVMAPKKLVPPLIVYLYIGTIVCRTIKLNAQSLGGTIEIHDIWSITMLAAELPAIQLAVLEVEPQKFLGGRCIVAQLPPAER